VTNQCQDRDLLAIEPGIFRGGGFASQRRCGGADGAVVATSFQAASADFAAAGVAAGMVLCVWSAAPEEGACYEIVSVDSPTELTVSIVRADAEDDPVAPPAGADLGWHVVTFAPQIAAAAATLGEKLRQIADAEAISPGHYADSAQFRRAVALAALAAVYVARAADAAGDDANWLKGEHYRRRAVEAAATVRLAEDADGDGLAERTRTLGHISLRRA
jgi:hypothetical protein